MVEKEAERNDVQDEGGFFNLVQKIENAYKIYRLSEILLKDVKDDYGKQKIARLRLEFARHQLMSLLDEARTKGIKLDGIDMLKKWHFPMSH